MEKLYQLGLINEDSGNWDEAVKNYISCLDIEPGHIQARIHLGWIYIQINNLDAALTEISAALKLKPDDEESLLCLSLIYLLKNELNLSRKILAGILQKNPTNLRANLGMGWICLRNNEPAMAESYLKKIDGLEANDAYLRTDLELIGKYYFNNGNYDLSEFWYEKIIRLAPDSFNYLWYFILNCFFQKKYEKILTKIETIKKLDLNAVSLNLSHFIAALEHCCRRNYDAAVDALKNISAINTDELPEYYLFLGKLYQYQGNMKLAGENFLKSLENFPNFIHAKIALEEIAGKI